MSGPSYDQARHIQAFTGMFDRENIPWIGVLDRQLFFMRRLEKSEMLGIDVGFRFAQPNLRMNTDEWQRRLG